MKTIELKPNPAGGLDLLTERDAGNLVLILTGKNSLEYFKRLRDVCDDAIDELENK